MAELLYKLKEWLTVSDAAAHLSIAFGEKVTEADVLRLGLDGHLTLSVNFVNGGYGRLGKVVPLKQATIRTVELPPKLRTVELPPKLRQKPFTTVGDVWFSKDEVFEFNDREKTKPDSIRGIWDLAMRGSEHLDVEHRHQALTGGPEVTLVGLDGAFVNRPDGTWCQLQTLIEVPVERVGFHGPRRKRSWIPAGGLPEDAEIVVKTAALDALTTPDEEPSTAAESSAVPFDFAGQDLETSEGRRSAVDAFLAHCNSEQQHILRRSHIWKAAGYGRSRSFEDWQAMRPKATRVCDENIRRILAMSVTDFLDLLRRKRHIQDK